jgi:hypothetical protein
MGSSPTPSITPAQNFPKVEFWTVDANGYNFINETTDMGQTYTNIEVVDLETVNTIAVSGSNIAILAYDENNNVEIQVSSDNYATQQMLDLSSISAYSFNKINLSGSNILLTGTDNNDVVTMLLSTDLGTTWNPLTVPPTVAGNDNIADSVSLDGNSILLKLMDSSFVVHLFYTSDLTNYTEITSALNSSSCQANDLLSNWLSNGNIVGVCSTNFNIYSNLASASSDITTNYLATGQASVSGVNVASSGDSIVTYSQAIFSFPPSVNAYYSLDAGVTFTAFPGPSLDAQIVQYDCGQANPCSYTGYPRINTFGTY